MFWKSDMDIDTTDRMLHAFKREIRSKKGVRPNVSERARRHRWASEM